MPAYWHLDRLDQKSLPLDKTFAINNVTGENVDIYIRTLVSIMHKHADFNGRAFYPGCDPIDKLEHQNQAGRDCEGHGTHIAGLVGGIVQELLMVSPCFLLEYLILGFWLLNLPLYRVWCVGLSIDKAGIKLVQLSTSPLQDCTLQKQ